MASSPPPAPRSSGHLWTILTAVAVVALLLVVGAGYGVAGYVTAGNKLTAANSAIDTATSHRSAFDSAPTAFEGQASDPKTMQSDADRFVQTWKDEAAMIEGDDSALTAADSNLHKQMWLTLVQRGNLDSASARITHARKALDVARTIAANRSKEGQFEQAYAAAVNDYATLLTDAQSSDLVGAVTAASHFQTDMTRVVGLSTDSQFPPELHQYMVVLQSLAKDLIDYLNASGRNDTAGTTAASNQTNADLAAADNFSMSSISSKIDTYYQPYIDTYHKELALAAGG